MNYSFLTATALFHGITQTELESMLICLNGRERKYPKETAILRVGDTTQELGLILSGSVSIESDDLWGNKTILDHIGAGCVFAETYACIPGEELMVNVITMEPSAILFLNTGRILEVCPKNCACHTKLVRNLLSISAQKNLNLSRRSFHTAPKSIRGRLLSYLSFQARKQGSRDFYISFNRQQLADYLNVDRSALSGELGKLQRENLIKTNKNHFIVSEQFTP